MKSDNYQAKPDFGGQFVFKKNKQNEHFMTLNQVVYLLN